jgi:serine/threonine-protein kinase
MTRYDFRALLMIVTLFSSACSNPAEDGEDVATALSIAAAIEEHVGVTSKSLPRLKAAPLGSGERRVMVFVVPGDASVEVDGRPVFRRSGVVEIVGRVGDVHKLRVFKGARSTEEKSVTIQEAGVTPNLVDLNEALPVAIGSGTKKNKPLVFGDIDE